MDGQRDGQRDGQAKTNMPPQLLRSWEHNYSMVNVKLAISKLIKF